MSMIPITNMTPTEFLALATIGLLGFAWSLRARIAWLNQKLSVQGRALNTQHQRILMLEIYANTDADIRNVYSTEDN